MTTTIHFIGKLHSALAGAIHLTIAGTDHFTYSNNFTNSFDVPLQLTPGVTYFIIISVNSQGTLAFDVQGQYHSITPKVPATLQNNMMNFMLTV